MATEDTLGYAALAQMLRGQAEQRKTDQLRQQNAVEDRRETQKSANTAHLDIWKIGELEKAKQAALQQGSLDRMALERSRSADRSVALHMRDENADLAREQQKALADAARVQRDSQEKGRRGDKQSGFFARYLSMKNADGSPMLSPEEAWKAASYHGTQEPDELQTPQQATPAGAPLQGASLAPGAPPALGTPPPGASANPLVAAGGPDIRRQETPFASSSERKEANQDIRGSVTHYQTGKSILQDLESVPDDMFGAGKSALRAARANTGQQTEQDQVERRIETNVNSKMQMWLSDLLLTKSGKTVTEGEFIRIAKAVGMAPDWIERSVGAFGKAGAVLAGAVAGGPVGAFAGANAAEAAINGLVGQMSSSILNKPNKREAVQGLQDYLENHKANTRIRSSQYKMEDPFGEDYALPSAPAPGGYSGVPEYRPAGGGRKPGVPVSDRMRRILEIGKKHLDSLTGDAGPSEAEGSSGGRNYNPDED